MSAIAIRDQTVAHVGDVDSIGNASFLPDHLAMRRPEPPSCSKASRSSNEQRRQLILSNVWLRCG